MSVLYQRAHTQFRRSWLIRRLWAGGGQVEQNPVLGLGQEGIEDFSEMPARRPGPCRRGQPHVGLDDIRLHAEALVVHAHEIGVRSGHSEASRPPGSSPSRRSSAVGGRRRARSREGVPAGERRQRYASARRCPPGHATCVSDLGNLRFELRGKLAVKLGAGMAPRRPRRSTSRRASRPRQRFLIEGRQCPIATTDPRCSSPVRSSTRRSGPTA